MAGKGSLRLRGLAWLLGAAGLVVLLMLGAGVVGGWRGWLPELENPFAEETTDRSQPVLLKSIQDMSRFTAATGEFEVIIDVETGFRFIPDLLVGERVLFVAAGTVDAYVEFGGLAEGALTVDETRGAVQIRLPSPQLEAPNLDHERSYVFADRRGVANRIGDLFDGDRDRQQQLLLQAERRIAEAAEASELRERAATNTRQMLEGMLGSLGFTEITVSYAEP
jgi:hypothetical protein